ncbi:MAG: hypothetical protein ACTHJK_12165 [Sphingomicrobium sp.]
MHKSLLILPLLLSATPAFAQDAPPPASIQLPPELTDPAAAMKLARTMQALSTAVLNIRVGDMKAALDGREATPEERNTTVGDIIRRKDPNFDRDVQHEVATVGPKVMRRMQAMKRVLPEVMRDVDDAQRSLKRAVSNLPDPNYPQR